jgi:iron(III) transport system permease protein
VVLFDPRAGLIKGVLRAVVGSIGVDLGAGPLDLYTPLGLILVTALYLVPYVFLIVSAALRKLDPYLEEASWISRARPFKTLVRVTLLVVVQSLLLLQRRVAPPGQSATVGGRGFRSAALRSGGGVAGRAD